MLDDLLILLIAVLIVMPVVAIVLMGLQRVSGRTWPPRALAGSALIITLLLLGAWILFLRPG